MNWYGGEDPFAKVGYARLFVVRHNFEYGFHGKKENCTQIVHIEAFAMGFACPKIAESKYSHTDKEWLPEEISTHCAHKVNHLFKSKPNGIYELIGDVYHWNSKSYEGEWEGDTELRDINIREISFNHMISFIPETTHDMYGDMFHLYSYSGANKLPQFDSDTCIHPYMTKQQILCNQANALTRIIESNGWSNTSYRDSKVEDLENCIHMLMLQIDSDKQYMQATALSMDQMVQDCLKAHDSFMVAEDEI